MKNENSILVAGTGRMALSIGEYFLDRGYRVSWCTTDRGRHQMLSRRMEKRRSRQLRLLGGGEQLTSGSCVLLQADSLPEVDVIIESTSENLEKKQTVMKIIADKCIAEPLFCSTSSSLVASQIMPGCQGSHFFYPVTLSPCVELFAEKKTSTTDTVKLAAFFEAADLQTVIVASAGPSVANRLLLPLQFFCLQALAHGMDARQVDQASVFDLLPMGQLAMMDNIGLEIMLAAVTQYRFYPVPGKVDFEAMEYILGRLVAMGKLGKKNGDGLLSGQQLPWKTSVQPDSVVETLRRSLYDCFTGSCCEALAREMLTFNGLCCLLEVGFHGINIEKHLHPASPV